MAIIRKSKIPTILGVVILLVGTFAGVFFLGMRQVFRIGADTQVAPKDMRVSSITDSVATVSWVTDKETKGFIVWGENQGSLERVEEEEAEGKFFVHSITLRGLKPETNYFYKVNSDGTSFDNNGIPWEFTTGATLGLNPNSQIVSGSVITPSGEPPERAVIYLTVNGYLSSTLTSPQGNFVFQLGNVRTQDLESYAQIDPAQTLLEISVQAGPKGTSSVQIFPQSANPIPPIILGQIYDLKGASPNQNGSAPSASLSLPEDEEAQSRFSIPTPSGSPASGSVILESISEGEVVTSENPAFFGRGPSGQSITITVESDPVTETVEIEGDGTWTWTPPTGLAPGAHTVTLSWLDTSGITRIITRNFIVQAGELPAFEASESGQTPTPSPTQTPKATVTPSPTASASPQPVPVTGDLTPTLLLSIMGLAVMLFSFIVWKNAESI